MNFVAADFFKEESRSPRGFLPRPLLRAGESVAPPPLPQKNSGGAHHFRFRFLDLCIRFGKIISKVCEGFNSGAYKKPPRCASWWFFICSGGGIRTHDQRINSPLRYRCATPESIKLSIIFFFSRKPFGDLRKNSL